MDTLLKVKQLSWIVGGSGTVTYAHAFGGFGFYKIRGKAGDWALEYPRDGALFIDTGIETQIEARRRAQADFETRVRECVEQVSDDMNDKTHPRFVAGYGAGLHDRELQQSLSSVVIP